MRGSSENYPQVDAIYPQTVHRTIHKLIHVWGVQPLLPEAVVTGRILGYNDDVAFSHLQDESCIKDETFAAEGNPLGHAADHDRKWGEKWVEIFDRL